MLGTVWYWGMETRVSYITDSTFSQGVNLNSFSVITEKPFPFSRLTFQNLPNSKRRCTRKDSVDVFANRCFSPVEIVSFRLHVNLIPDFNEFAYLIHEIP